VLREAGYTVLETANGKEALRLAGTLQEAPGLVLSDVVMPEMSGPELGENLARKWPEVPVLYASGYTDHALLAGKVLKQANAFLQKPYTSQALLERVALVLEHARRPTALVVDDDARIRGLLRETLEERGYSVIEAADGREALAYAAARQIRLVITDLAMPEKDGLETIQTLRRNYPDIKVIATSGFLGGSYLRVAAQLGAHGMLPKPFQHDDVLQAVGDVLG
jgi:CheY-like chemotaxis protein